VPDAPKAELLRSLGRVVRALTTLFWALPITLIAYVQTAHTGWFDFFGPFSILPAMALTGLIWRALCLLQSFQPQEAIWIRALDRASVFALLNLGLVPFLYWWRRMPTVPLYNCCVAFIVISSLLLLIHINYVLRRLTAMLPDETLRAETTTFTRMNTASLSTLTGALLIYFLLLQINSLPEGVAQWLAMVGPDGLWLAVFLTLMPMAITMSLIWKIKEIIFTSVFGAGS
jgi:hypothetical protein